jgi:putative membrane protein
MKTSRSAIQKKFASISSLKRTMNTAAIATSSTIAKKIVFFVSLPFKKKRLPNKIHAQESNFFGVVVPLREILHLKYNKVLYLYVTFGFWVSEKVREKNILVICIDRDDDLGRKTGITGPVVGKKQNFNAAAKLALADPSDSDSNTIFAAVRKFDELQDEFKQIEVATLTGYSKTGFESDKRINEQLDIVLEKFPADAFVLVTDGGEDDQTIPILQSRAPIISKEMVIIKQAREVESTYYTIKEALKDSGVKRIVFLMPGLVILLWGFLFLAGFEKFFLQAMSIVVGTYLILKGTGLEEILASGVSSIVNSISLQRVSFPFYLMTILLIVLGVYSAYITYIGPEHISIFMKTSSIVKQGLLFIALAGISFCIGNGIDSIHLKKAFLLRKISLTVVAIAILWFILDSARAVIVGEPHASLEWFAINIILSFLLAVISYKATKVLDVRKKITKLLVGIPVYSRDGKWLGKVETVFNDRQEIMFMNNQTKTGMNVGRKMFILKKGRIILTGDTV